MREKRIQGRTSASLVLALLLASAALVAPPLLAQEQEGVQPEDAMADPGAPSAAPAGDGEAQPEPDAELAAPPPAGETPPEPPATAEPDAPAADAMAEPKGEAQAPESGEQAASETEPVDPNRLAIGTDYRSAAYRQVTGLIFSEAHGKRLVRTFVKPAAAAKIYRQNAAKVRQGVATGLAAFPEGTIIVQESFQRGRAGAPGPPGPLFVMKKEAPGYDSSGNDWRYAFAQPDLQLIGDGTRGPVSACKACHETVKERDFVVASDR